MPLIKSTNILLNPFYLNPKKEKTILGIKDCAAFAVIEKAITVNCWPCISLIMCTVSSSFELIFILMGIQIESRKIIKEFKRKFGYKEEKKRLKPTGSIT